MAKKTEKVIKVANPKIGKQYRFIFGGHSEQVGTLEQVNEDLTKHYGYKWYTFSVPASAEEARRMGKPNWTYPSSIFDIIEQVK